MSQPTFGSVFTGIGGFDRGLERAGWRCAWMIEVDPFCRQVLAKRWPGVPIYADVRTVRGASDVRLASDGDGAVIHRGHAGPGAGALDDEDAGGAGAILEPVDLLVGGFPCQDLSVVGRRKGIHAERSGLVWEFLRLADELRPRWLLQENVPGLFTSHRGRDFALLLHALAERGYRWAWRVLDSRWFDVAQRRERVFLVSHLGAECPPPVLFEPEGRARDLAPGGETRPDVAANPRSRSRSPGVPIPGRGGEDDQNLVLDGWRLNTGPESGPLKAGPGHGWNYDSAPIVATSLKAGRSGLRLDDQLVVHAAGQDADPIGANEARTYTNEGKHFRPHNLLVVGFQTDGHGGTEAEELTPPLMASSDRPSNQIQGVLFLHVNKGRPDGRQSRHEELVTVKAEVPTLGTDGHQRSAVAYTVTPAPARGNTVAHETDQAGAVSGSKGARPDGRQSGTVIMQNGSDVQARQDEAGALRDGHMIGHPIVLQDARGLAKDQNGLGVSEEGVAYTLDQTAEQAVAPSAGLVRRLTPTECEKLQGFPPGWTCLEVDFGADGVARFPDGRPYSTWDCRCPDSRRYRALGNAVTETVAFWIGGRVGAAHTRVTRDT